MSSPMNALVSEGRRSCTMRLAFQQRTACIALQNTAPRAPPALVFFASVRSKAGAHLHPHTSPNPRTGRWELNRLNPASWLFRGLTASWCANSISSTGKMIMPQIQSVVPPIFQAARFVWNEERTGLHKDTRNLLPKHAWSTTGPETCF